jgi:succinate dehydrogenase / fumarate reductase flavoprotein subunit
VVAYELATGELHVFRAKSVVFATGAFGKMFKVTSNAHALTGDGPAVVYRRGLPLQDMEFFQFHPTGLYRLGILLSEAAGARAVSSGTATGRRSWSATPRRSRTSPPATWRAGRSTPRSARGAVPGRTATMSTWTSATWIPR